MVREYDLDVNIADRLFVTRILSNPPAAGIFIGVRFAVGTDR